MKVETMNKNGKTMFSRVVLATACTLALAGPTVAEGAYVGVSAGQSSMGMGEACLAFADISCTENDSDSSLELLVGGQPNPNLAIEFGYVNFGELGVTGSDSFYGPNSFFKWTADALFVSVNGIIPLGQRAGLFGKLGVHWWHVEADYSNLIEPGSDSGFGPLFGIGAFFDLGQHFAIRAEWERFNAIGDKNETGEGDVDRLSAGLIFKF